MKGTMRIVISYLCLLLLVLPSPAAAFQGLTDDTVPDWVEDPAPPDMSMPWGAPVAEFAGAVKYKSVEGVDYYRFPGSNACPLFAGDTADISLAFRDGELYAYFSEIEYVQDFEQSLTLMRNIYGQGNEVVEGDTVVYKWKVGVEKIKLKHDRKTGGMKLAFYHAP